jgi:hypothetical protein
MVRENEPDYGTTLISMGKLLAGVGNTTQIDAATKCPAKRSFPLRREILSANAARRTEHPLCGL